MSGPSDFAIYTQIRDTGVNANRPALSFDPSRIPPKPTPTPFRIPFDGRLHVPMPVKT